MRKLFLFLACFFSALALVFALMPMDTIAFLPIGLAFVFCLLLLKKSTGNQKRLPQILLFICALSSVFVLGKTLLIKDEVEKDAQFEQQKIETKQEAKQELENLEKDLE
ncbi:hypothetical protein [Flavobacterium wongokense]|uniref:hypothetical protein n=1 Tax=Flavobacterium wongokense TaxID=2910674 RepID=UPI001F1650B0|nr:hypothetical protein [Flavobacterium sp. WG47]MCF6131177.1 hypothetical protein [Flavobacterium sp. WG47]